MKDHSTSGSPWSAKRWPRRSLLAAAALAGLLAPAVVGGRAFAALPTVGGTCGFHLGEPFETGAAGSFGFEVPVYPANPHQTCQATVTARASLMAASGAGYTNVANDPATQTITLAFTGGPVPLGVLWVWSPHCADPAAPGVFTMTVDSQSSSMPLSAMSCSLGFGGSSSLSFNRVDPADTNIEVGVAGTTDGHGYWTVSASGVVQARGDATWSGDAPFSNLADVGIVADPTGHGYWVVAADGGVFSFGGASFHGSLGGVHLNAPVVAMAPTPDGVGGGYWLVAADGGVFSFGDAAFHGSLGAVHLNAPVVGVAPTPDGVGGGYWLAAYDGGVFSFGDAAFEGSAGALSLAAPVYGVSPTPSGHGYWVLGGDGGIFTYGDAGFYGATPLEP
jgi:hypothetical protein